MPGDTILQNGRLRAAVVPGLGAGLADFSIAGPSGYFSPVLRRAAPGETNPSLLGSFVMAPWVNRIGGARFVYRGREVVLRPTTKDGMAQHGDVRRRAFRVVDQGPTSVHAVFDSRRAGPQDAAGSMNWPWAFVCEVEYRLFGPGEDASDGGGGVDDAEIGSLRMDLSVTNVDTEAFPAGVGHHPYFSRRLWNDADELEIEAACAGRYPLVNGCASGAMAEDELTRRLRRFATLPDEHVDAVLGGFEGVARLRWAKSGIELEMRASEEMGHLVVFGPRVNGDAGFGAGGALGYVAVEPQTQVNDALNAGSKGVAETGTMELEPGQTLATRVRLVVREIAE